MRALRAYRKPQIVNRKKMNYGIYFNIYRRRLC